MSNNSPNEEFRRKYHINSIDNGGGDQEERKRRIKRAISYMQKPLVLKSKDLNRLILAKKNRENESVHWRTNYYGSETGSKKGRTVVQAQLYTVGCINKCKGSCWECNYDLNEEVSFSTDDYLLDFQNGLRAIEKKLEEEGKEEDVLVLESLGSITDFNHEVSEDVFKGILEYAIKNSSFKTILIETHLLYIYCDTVNYIQALKEETGTKKNIGFEVGIEDMNPEHRILINKPSVTDQSFRRVYNMLKEAGLLLSVNLIYGFPFMTKQQQVDAVIESMRKIASETSNEQGKPDDNVDIVIFLMSIKENTILHEIYKMGEYEKPNPWGLVEITKRILEDEQLSKLNFSFSWFGEKQEDPGIKNDTNEDEGIINFLKEINGSMFDARSERLKMVYKFIEERREDYEVYKKDLKECSSEGKDPIIQYYEFLDKVRRKIIVEKYRRRIRRNNGGGSSSKGVGNQQHGERE